MREKYGQRVKGHDMQALGMIKHEISPYVRMLKNQLHLTVLTFRGDGPQLRPNKDFLQQPLPFVPGLSYLLPAPNVNN